VVEQCFDQADLDGNGSLDFDEFKQAVLQHQVRTCPGGGHCVLFTTLTPLCCHPGQIVVQSFWKAGVWAVLQFPFLSTRSL
jgi:hypothetical protein